MHDADCPAVGNYDFRAAPHREYLRYTIRCRFSGKRALEKGFVSTKLKCTMSETPLGKSDPWHEQEKRGNPVDSAAVYAYIAHVRVE